MKKMLALVLVALVSVSTFAQGVFTSKLSFTGLVDGAVVGEDQFVDTLHVRLESAGVLSVKSIDGVPCLTASGLNPIYIRFVGLDSQPTTTQIGTAVVMTEEIGPNWSIGLRCANASIGASGNDTQVLPFSDYFVTPSEELWFVAGNQNQGIREVTFVPIPESATGTFMIIGIVVLLLGRILYGPSRKRY